MCRRSDVMSKGKKRSGARPGRPQPLRGTKGKRKGEFLTLMRPSLVLFLVLWLKLVKDFLKVRCRLALLPFLISCLIWLDLVASLPLIKERILVIILLLHFLSLMLGSVLVLMLPLLVWLTPDLRIKKSLLK